MFMSKINVEFFFSVLSSSDYQAYTNLMRQIEGCGLHVSILKVIGNDLCFECLAEFICKTIWDCCFLYRKILTCSFNLFNNYRTIQVFYDF